MLGLILLTSIGAVPANAPGWATFSAQRPFSQPSDVTMGVLENHVGVFGKEEYWFRLNGKGAVSWTDTKRCPAALAAIRAMRDISVRPATVGDPVRAGPPPEPSHYSLSTKAMVGDRDGFAKVTTHDGTPLANWIDTTLGILSSCWSDTAPQR